MPDRVSLPPHALEALLESMNKDWRLVEFTDDWRDLDAVRQTKRAAIWASAFLSALSDRDLAQMGLVELSPKEVRSLLRGSLAWASESKAERLEYEAAAYKLERPLAASRPDPGLFSPTGGCGPENGGGDLAPEYCWGCDPKTWRVSLAAEPLKLSPDPTPECAMSVEVDRGLRGGERMHALHEATFAAALAFAERFPPMLVYVEQLVVFPGRTDPELYMASGAIEAALFGALRDVFEHPVSVLRLPPATWKLGAVGRGNAKKPEILRWARSRGYSGLIEDEADALGIAVAGANRVRAGEQLALGA